MDFPMAQGDLLPLLDEVLIGINGKAPDLTGLTVTFKMRPADGCAGLRIERAAEIVDAKGGAVRYSWVAGDTDIPGNYVANWEVVIDGRPLSFPNRGYINVTIRAKV